MKLVVSFTIHLVSFKIQNLWLLSLRLTIEANPSGGGMGYEVRHIVFSYFFNQICTVSFLSGAVSTPRHSN